jgi:hypothetical protein
MSPTFGYAFFSLKKALVRRFSIHNLQFVMTISILDVLSDSVNAYSYTLFRLVQICLFRVIYLDHNIGY